MPKIGYILRSDNSKVQLGNLIASALGLGTFMLLTRILDKEEFGQWAIFMACVGLIDLLRSGLIRQAMVRSIAVGEKSDYRKISGSALTLLTLLTVLLFFLGICISMVLGPVVNDYQVFLNWYPWLLLASTPQVFDTWITQSKNQYSGMMLIRIGVNAMFVIIICVGFLNGFVLKDYLAGLVVANLAVSVASQLYTKSVSALKFSSATQVKELLRFGKHSLASLLGVNLLRSSDSLIIGALLGAPAAATYAIPLKVIDIIEIPVRGFAMTSFSKLSRFYHEQQFDLFRSHFVKSTGFLILFFLPAAILFLFFPKLPILILGGEEYLNGQLLIQIFVVAMMLIPLDKFLGVAFDSINQPQVNALKVWMMVLTNIVGDLLAITYIGELWAVAIVTMANILLGVIFGLWRHPLLKNLTWHATLRGELYHIFKTVAPKQVSSITSVDESPK